MPTATTLDQKDATRAEEPLAIWNPGDPVPNEIPRGLAYKMRAAIHHRRLASILREPDAHESARKMFADACAMLRAGLHRAEAEYVLRFTFRNYYRPIEDREFERAVENASIHLEKDGGVFTGPRFPRPNPAEISRIVAAAPHDALKHLKESSPTRNPGSLSAGHVVSRIFPGDPLLCLATEKSRAYTEPRSHFIGEEADHPFIVPNAMSNRWGLTQAGKPSVRSLTNVGPRQHVVVEFDTGSLDQQAALILRLATQAPLRMVVFSGRKSLHAWFGTAGASPEGVEAFMRYAAFLGADTATFNPVQLVRTPNAWRDENTLQEVLWLEADNPPPGT